MSPSKFSGSSQKTGTAKPAQKPAQAQQAQPKPVQKPMQGKPANKS